MYAENLVKTVEYGTKTGTLVIYFHGAPGTIEECAVFDRYARHNNLRIVCLDRFSIQHTTDAEPYYQQLAKHIKCFAGEESFDIIGFSIGAHVALEVSALLQQQIRNIHLISSAAPLNKGDFIDHMAGGLVFKLAMDRPLIFRFLTYCQKVMAVLAPKMLVRMLFATAAGKDHELIKAPDFNHHITAVLKQCFKNGSKGYLRDINFYVNWTDDIDIQNSNVHLWHGTDDNWSPFSMAKYLRKAMHGDVHLEAMKGLSHYSCLYAAAPKICAQIGDS